MWILSAIIISITLVVPTLSKTCDNDPCNTEFMESYPFAVETFSALLSKGDLTSCCSKYKNVADCEVADADNCTSSTVLEWTQLKPVLDFMCSDDTKLLVEAQESCMEEESLTENLDVCGEAISSADEDDVCDEVKGYKKCADLIAGKCGEAIDVWYEDLTDLVAEGQVNFYDCESGAGSLIPHLAVLLVSMAPLFFGF